MEKEIYHLATVWEWQGKDVDRVVVTVKDKNGKVLFNPWQLFTIERKTFRQK